MTYSKDVEFSIPYSTDIGQNEREALDAAVKLAAKEDFPVQFSDPYEMGKYWDLKDGIYKPVLRYSSFFIIDGPKPSKWSVRGIGEPVIAPAGSSGGSPSVDGSK